MSLRIPYDIPLPIYGEAPLFFHLPHTNQDLIFLTFFPTSIPTPVSVGPNYIALPMPDTANVITCPICHLHALPHVRKHPTDASTFELVTALPSIGLRNRRGKGKRDSVFHQQCLMAVLSGDGDGMVWVGEVVLSVREWVRVKGWGTDMLDQAIERVMTKRVIELAGRSSS